MHSNKYREGVKTEKQRNTPHMKERQKFSLKRTNEKEASNLSEFKTMVIKMLSKLKIRMNKCTETLKREMASK